DVLALPQPASEWSRLREEEIQRAFGGRFWRTMRRVALDATLPLGQRLRAIRILAPRFNSLPSDFLKGLQADAAVAMRGQAAWFEVAMGKSNPQIRLRALVACLIRREPPVDEAVHRAVKQLLDDADVSVSERAQPAREPGTNDARRTARTGRARSFTSEDRLD